MARASRKSNLHHEEGGLDVLLGQDSQELLVVDAGTIVKGQSDGAGGSAGVDLGRVIGHDGRDHRGHEEGGEGDDGGRDLHCVVIESGGLCKRRVCGVLVIG